MSTSSIPVVSGKEKAFAWVIMSGCVAVSCMQAASYYWSMAETGLQKVWLVTTVLVLLLGSQCLVNFLGKAIVVGGLNLWQWFGIGACACIVFMLECFSIYSSNEAMEGRMESAARAQKHSSPEYTRLVAQITDLQVDIDEARRTLRNTPDTWATKKAEIREQIAAMRSEKKGMESELKTSGVTTIDLDNSTMVMNMAIMLSATPLAINFAMGALVGLGGLAGGSRAKKSQGAAQPLRAAA